MPERVAYMDGINFCYGAVRNPTDLKWLNPQTMLRRLLPDPSAGTQW